MKKKIKVAYISGDLIDARHFAKCLVQEIESEASILDVLEMVREALKDGEDEELTIKVKYITKDAYEKLECSD